jgi:hypothetical protein
MKNSRFVLWFMRVIAAAGRGLRGLRGKSHKRIDAKNLFQEIRTIDVQREFMLPRGKLFVGTDIPPFLTDEMRPIPLGGSPLLLSRTIPIPPAKHFAEFGICRSRPRTTLSESDTRGAMLIDRDSSPPSISSSLNDLLASLSGAGERCSGCKICTEISLLWPDHCVPGETARSTPEAGKTDEQKK